MAWFIGGLIILGVTLARRKTENTVGATVDDLTWPKALAIGGIQCVAMIPGTSRSLTTILGGVWVGMSMVASVEFSFLLGLVTLTAATIFKMRHVGTMHHFLGTTSPDDRHRIRRRRRVHRRQMDDRLPEPPRPGHLRLLSPRRRGSA